MEKPRMLEAIDLEAAQEYAKKGCKTCTGNGQVRVHFAGRNKYVYARSCVCAIARWHDAMSEWLEQEPPSGLVTPEGNPIPVHVNLGRAKA